MIYVREVTKLTIITLGYIDYFYLHYALASMAEGMSWWTLNPCVPGLNLGNRMIFFFLLFVYFFMFFCHYYYSANLQIQHYCLYSVSPTLLLLMMPRPLAPSAL